jgi:hypothetical protein
MNIKINDILSGRGITIKILRVGLGIVIVERLDLGKHPELFRIHPLLKESLTGLQKVRQ